MTMDFVRDRRLVILVGLVAALAFGLLIAWLLGGWGEDPDTPPPASVGGLVVEVEAPELNIDLTRELPCYVSGELIGLATHAECAEQNGVSSGQLDVGVTESGDLAYGEAGTSLAPLPPGDLANDPIGAILAGGDRARDLRTTPPPAAPTQSASGEPLAACWRYSDRNWQRISDVPLTACVQILFDGRCERPGGALYGRWGDRTLRLVPGRVEQSSDNRNFDTLVRQGSNCASGAF